MSDKKLGNKKNKLFKRFGIFFGVLLLLSLLGAFTAPLILKKAIVSELQKLGFDEAEVKSAYLTPAGFDVQGVILSSDMQNKIGYLRIETTIANILKGRANNIILDRIQLNIPFLQSKLAHLQTGKQEVEQARGSFALPFDRLWLRNSSWRYRGTKLQVKGSFDKARQSQDMHLKASFSVIDDKFEITGKTIGQMRHFDDFDIKTDIDQFTSKDDKYQAKRFTAHMTIAQEPQKDLTYQGKMDIGHLQLGDLPLQTVQMQAFADDKAVNFIMNAQMPGKAASLSIDAKGQDFQDMTAAAHVTLHDLSKLQYIKGDWRALTKMSGKGEISANIAAKLDEASVGGVLLDVASSFNLYDLSYGDFIKDAAVSGTFYKKPDEQEADLTLSSNTYVKMSDADLHFKSDQDIAATFSLAALGNVGFTAQLPALSLAMQDVSVSLPKMLNVTGRYAYMKNEFDDLNVKYQGNISSVYDRDLSLKIQNSDLNLEQVAAQSFALKQKIKGLTVQYKNMQIAPKLYGQLSGRVGTAAQKLKLGLDDGVGNFIVKADYTQKDQNNLSFEASLHPLTFDADLYTIYEAFPFARKWEMGNETGEIGAKLKLVKKHGTWAEQFAELMVQDFGFDMPLSTVRGVNMVLSTQQILPTLKLDKQSLFVGASDYIAPLQHLYMQFGYDQAQNMVRVDDFSVNFAEGVVQLSNQIIDFNKGVQDIELSAQNVDLLTLFNHTNLKGINASGRLDGHAVLQMLDKTPYIRIIDGKLASLKQGYFKYAPADMPDFLRNPSNVGLIQLKQALNNFHYDEITLSLDMADQKSQQVQLKAIGKNPDFYDGKPVHINLNLEGQVENVLKQNMQTYQVPDQIKEKLEAYHNNAD